MSEVSVWTSTKEGMRELQEERLILVVTEAICRLMKEKDVNRKGLANRLGISPGRVSQMLDGGANLTLRRVAAMFAALGRTMIVGDKPLTVEEQPTSFARICLTSPNWPAWPSWPESAIPDSTDTPELAA